MERTYASEPEPGYEWTFADEPLASSGLIGKFRREAKVPIGVKSMGWGNRLSFGAEEERKH